MKRIRILRRIADGALFVALLSSNATATGYRMPGLPQGGVPACDLSVSLTYEAFGGRIHAVMVLFDVRSGRYFGRIVRAETEIVRDDVLARFLRQTSCTADAVIGASFRFPTLELRESRLKAGSMEEARKAILDASPRTDDFPNLSVERMFSLRRIELARRLAGHCPECKLEPTTWTSARLTDFIRDGTIWHISLEDPKGDRTTAALDDSDAVIGGSYKGLALK